MAVKETIVCRGWSVVVESRVAVREGEEEEREKLRALIGCVVVGLGTKYKETVGIASVYDAPFAIFFYISQGVEPRTPVRIGLLSRSM